MFHGTMALYHYKGHNNNKWKTLKRIPCPIQSKELPKLFNYKVRKPFERILNLPECLKMPTIYFSQCP